MHVQVDAAKRRRAAVPESAHRKRSEKIVKSDALAGTQFCGGCQSYRDDEDFGKGMTQCRPCVSMKSHESRVQATYGLQPGDYEHLMELQDGRCAICGNRPVSKRLVVDHNHRTGAVRGLLCGGKDSSGCNFAIGLLHDDVEIIRAAVRYMENPPAQSKQWRRPKNADGSRFTPPSANGKPAKSAEDEACSRPHFLPVGSESVPGQPGVYRVYVENGTPPF